jgi:hypothetical protein
MSFQLRNVARQFHAIATRASQDRKSLAEVVVHVGICRGLMTMSAVLDEIVVEARHACDLADQHHAIAFAALQDLHELPAASGLQQPPRVLEEPAQWSTPQARLIPALRDAVAVTTRDTMRYALNRVQLIASKGVAVGTDSRQVVIAKGLELPCADSVLIPACRVFASRELANIEARIGITADHVIVEGGPWRFGFRIDRVGNYPDVFRVLPRSFGTTWQTGEGDEGAIRDAVAKAGQTDDPGITLHLVPPSASIVTDKTNAKSLPHSTVSGQPLSVTLTTKNVTRFLDLGLHTVRFAGPDKPFVAADRQRTYFAMMIDAASLPASTTPTPTTTRPMKPEPLTRHAPVPPTNDDGFDPLVEAEALRNALGDVITRASRLLVALKSKRKEQKALSQVFTSLKALKLGAE